MLMALVGCNNGEAKDTDTKGKTEAGQTAGKEAQLFAIFETSLGNIEVKLFSKEAPKTVQNFVELAKGEKEWTDPKTLDKTKKPLYDGTIFHRVIPNFMIQGGDPKGNGTGGPGYTFEDEFSPTLKFDRPGLLAMANRGPNTNGSQFFITDQATPHLNNRHTIFGEVTSGLDIVKAIARAPRDGRDKPMEDVVIKHLRIVER
ncbi:MAG: peptidylprolyl isomerase [Myxococcales bacterium]|nr:MAG: peptidylprolyl isomerase [Myxococcales bacterium]